MKNTMPAGSDQTSDYFNDPDNIGIDDDLDEAMAAEEEIAKKHYDAKDDYPFMSKQVAQQKGIRFKNKEDVAAQLSPGRMTGDVKIMLHTRQAHRLYHGRRRDSKNGIEPVTGLIRFAGQMNQIWLAAGNDDPYADYFLYEIERALEAADENIQELIEVLEQQLNKLKQRGYRITLQESTQPIELSLKFAPEFTHKAALSLLEFDYLVRMVLSLRHAAVLKRDKANHYLVSASGRIRHAFEMSLRYKRLMVTRDDIAANNGRAQDAATKMRVKLPQPILEGIIRADVSPPLPKKRQNAIDLAQQASASRQASKEQQSSESITDNKKTGSVTIINKKRKIEPASSEADK